MPTASVYDMDGKIVREETLDEYVFGAPVNPALLHQVVTAQLVNRRQGNANTKTRAEVSGGNRKPYRQKGTGHARQGSTRAPHYRGGGTVFGPQPHAYERDIPRKMRRLAIRSALSDKAANGRILLMDSLTFDEPRTKAMLALLENLPLERHVLLLLPERNQNVILSARNIHRVKTGNVSSINVVELLKYDHLLMPTATVAKIVAMFGEEADEALQMKRHPRVAIRHRARRELIAAQRASAGKTAGGATATATATAPAAEKKTRSTKAAAQPSDTSAATTDTSTTGTSGATGSTSRRRSRSTGETGE